MPSRTNFAISTRLVKFDLNCDLGENEPAARTAVLMQYVSSANIACGGHAGGVRSMRAAIRLAVRNKVRIGAHPGFYDRPNFGRLAQPLTPTEFEVLLLQQISALERIARETDAQLHHIKLHGA